MKFLIIIATYNEKENIPPILEQVYTFVPDAHVLVVDDSSPDKTYEIVGHLANTQYQNKLFLLQRAGKLGLGSAYVAGFNWALEREYDTIMHMDADFSHNPKYIPEFLTEIKTNDLVLGSRYVQGGGVVNWGLVRRFISVGGSIYSRFILGIKVRDLTGGFKCFRASTLRTIDVNNLKANGYAFQVETTYKTYLHGLKIKEIPIIFEDRRVGHSKMSAKIFIEALWVVILLRLRGKS